VRAAVAVIMPCLNVESTIDEAVESVLEGSFRDFELIAVDDGSTDGTVGRLAAWQGRDRRVKLIRRPRRGIIPALNAGLGASQAPLVARMDGDDISLPDRLSKQVEWMEAQSDLDVVGSLVRGFPESHVRRGFEIYIEWLNSLVNHQDIVREIFVESPLAHPSVVMRRTSVDRVGGYQDHGWPEDYDLWLRLYQAGARFAKVPEVLLLWREHADRATRTDSRYSVENFLRAKAHYLAKGPLADRDGVIVWGAGQMGKRLSKHLLREDVSLVAFVDVDPTKIGRRRRNRPIIPVDALNDWWVKFERPTVLAAVGSRGARKLIRRQLLDRGLVEGQDWWAVA
jgi:glycosyltransferase involved in cell wall biosynthesis